MKFDAVKAFDRLWTDAVLLKVKKKFNFLAMVILLKIYYDKLQAKVKINNCFSRLFKVKNEINKVVFYMVIYLIVL